ncbi:AAA family ATPase [Ollibium composti]|uniref:AAA+ ATPase domain-containing protein n=1 Tax=Ollibium composti TaxID=2675109 RepID=A0ABY2QAZ9_9HYPH|nr:AAA family ATPase [Mesorhizobium composti]THF58853.1 hypothetical protein E6C48_04145 [Mesorhizobium composti]
MTARHTEPALKGLTAAQLLARQFPPREFVIDPWLRTGESALIWAATGVGKTWLTLSLAMAIAGGGRVWEWKASKPRKVLIIDGEMNVQDLQERVRFLLDTRGVDGVDRRELDRNILFMPRQYQDPRSTFFDITNTDDQHRILALMEEQEAEAIIIDNLTTCADGLDDENAATAFRSIMSFLMKMKQADKTAIVVHYANKTGTDARGSTALEATFEVKLGLQRPAVSKPGSAAFVTTFGKFRGRGDDSLSPRTWSLSEAGWSVEEDADSVNGRVVAALETLRYVNQAELAKALGMSQPTVSRALTRAAALGAPRKDEVERLFIKAREMRRAEKDPFADTAEPAEEVLPGINEEF